MEWLIVLGAILSLAGVAGLVWCIVLALRIRRANAPEEVVRGKLQRIVMVNLIALGVSSLGLMLVVAGILLG
ncbi:hypothetical protein [Falsirhodobacter xinxiangensis]|uniref:hypothetical protein n=1 Tax=Falsirhodobacter xinxiangensis TaxID=2530049 RepID=UPI0010AA9E76|nr:hypothetical protein [Rhodobacter xinxiangensis]